MSSLQPLFRYDWLFGDTDDAASLQHRSVRGGLLTAGGQLVTFGTRLTGAIVLARLLKPADFGLVNMVAAIAGLAQIFQDLGLATATIQSRKISHAQVSTLFWVNVGIAFTTMAIVGASGPLIAWFYNEPRLLGITLLLAPSFLLAGLGVQHQALLRRRMSFGRLALVQSIAAVVGVISAVLLAASGAGYWSLVALTVITAMVGAVILWVAMPWVPARPVRGSGVRRMLRFGAHISGFNIVNYFSRNLDNILIGRAWGPTQLGLYANAYQLLMVPITQIRSPLDAVALPAMSQLSDKPEQYEAYYLRFAHVLSVLTMPLIAGLVGAASDLVPFLLGPDWAGAAPIFAALAIAGLIQPVLGTQGLVMVSLGQTSRYLRFGVFVATVSILSFLIGLPWGALGVAISYAIGSYVSLVPTLPYSFRHSPVHTASFLRTISLPLLSSACLGAILYLGVPELGIQGAVGRLIVCAAATGALFTVLGIGLLKSYPGLAAALGLLKR